MCRKLEEKEKEMTNLKRPLKDDMEKEQKLEVNWDNLGLNFVKFSSPMPTLFIIQQKTFPIPHPNTLSHTETHKRLKFFLLLVVHVYV